LTPPPAPLEPVVSLAVPADDDIATLDASGRSEMSATICAPLSGAKSPDTGATSGLVALVDVADARSPSLGDSNELSVIDHSHVKADVWSLGLSLYVLLCGRLPWDITEGRRAFAAAVAADAEVPFDPSELLPPRQAEAGAAIVNLLATEWAKILRGCLAKDPQQRWSVERARSEVKRVCEDLEEAAIAASPPVCRRRSSSADVASPVLTTVRPHDRKLSNTTSL